MSADDPLGAARAEFAGLLGPDVKAFPPAKLSPGGFVIPGDPWLEPGDTFGSFLCRLDGLLLFKSVNNETATTDINTAVANAVVALANAKWRVRSVAAPRSLSNEGESVKYLAVQITATKPIGL